MGEWDTILNEEFDGHLVMIEVRRRNFEASPGQDERAGIRVTVTCLRDCDDETDIVTTAYNVEASSDMAIAAMTFVFDALDELEGDLIEIGFSPDAAARISSKIPDWAKLSTESVS